MNLLENLSTYNLSESKFSLGIAIFDIKSEEFVDLRDFNYLLRAQTQIGTPLKKKFFTNDYNPCNKKNGDFDKINFNVNVDKFKQGEIINSSMCFDMKKATLQSDYLLLGKGFVITFF